MDKFCNRIDEIEQKVAMGEMDAFQCFTQMRQMVDAARSQSALLPLYREVVGSIVIAPDAGIALENMRCWWDREKMLRIAMDLPEREGRAFIGR
ncbi:hypothetical protein [Chromobacterium haemolyticum]|uniref:hypothetical protein n=1 Tax=Chromobacterium haemolyticum TaxID=394935 RepID=UPI000D3211C8|nr:hypothetical protein [Chromobacterium haemolyticum]PTU71459.1 hypothetical protein DBB33_19390 [Chromobacterium haemolyticum]